MARGNHYKCDICGKEYEYCPQCELTERPYNARRFCCDKHAKIFAILSENGCNLISADETLKKLEQYDIDKINFEPSIKAHIKDLKVKVKPVKEEQKK